MDNFLNIDITREELILRIQTASLYRDEVIRDFDGSCYHCYICNATINNVLNENELPTPRMVYNHIFNHIVYQNVLTNRDYIAYLTNINYDFDMDYFNISDLNNFNIENIIFVDEFSNEDNQICICPICSDEFDTELELNNHFLEVHNDYNELNNLDKKKNHSFCGYDLLNKINMINFKKCNEKECYICYEEYNHNIHSKDDNDINKYYDFIKKEKSKIYIFNDDMNIDIETKKIIPLNLKCCNTHICNLCIKSHIEENGLTCPFCRKNHQISNKKIITFNDKNNNISFTNFINNYDSDYTISEYNETDSEYSNEYNDEIDNDESDNSLSDNSESDNEIYIDLWDDDDKDCSSSEINIDDE